MCSASSPDLTARARIRDAAIECFARQGFAVSVRAIAAHAGVSPGLVIHHFGSKAGLREVCDAHVIGLVAVLEVEELGDGDSLLTHLASMDEFADLLAYVMRSFQAGGALASQMFERMVADTARQFARGVENGTVRPSRDPEGRARLAVASAVGSLLVVLTLRHPGPEVDYKLVLREWTEELMIPSLELYSEGILTNSAMLDAYVAHLRDGGPDPTGSGDTPATGSPGG